MLQRLIQSRGAVAKENHPCFKRSLQMYCASGRNAGFKFFEFCISSVVISWLATEWSSNTSQTQLFPIFLVFLIATIVVRVLDTLIAAAADTTPSRTRPDLPSSPRRFSPPSLSPLQLNTNLDTIPLHRGADTTQMTCVTSSATALAITACDESRLLLGLKEKWNIGIDQIDFKRRAVKYDGDFIDALRRLYRSLRAFWKRWFSVYQLKTMEYRHVSVRALDAVTSSNVCIQFYKQRCNFVSRGDTNRPLPKHIPDYEYRYGETVPPDPRRPPISPDEFYCCLNLCSRACWWTCLPWHSCNPPSDELTMMDRVPKKKSFWELQARGHDSAWGLECRFEISFARNVCYHMIMLLTGVSFWGWWQAYHPGDLQNATAPLMVLIGIVSVYWTSVGILRTPE